MKVFVTGSTGFVGNHVLHELVEKGHQVGALVRPGSEHKLKRPDDVEKIPGTVDEVADLIQGMQGCDAIIHLVGIIRAFPSRGITFERLHTEATANVLAAAKETGTSRLLHMSALGAREDGPTPYLRTKFAAEERHVMTIPECKYIAPFIYQLLPVPEFCFARIHVGHVEIQGILRTFVWDVAGIVIGRLIFQFPPLLAVIRAWLVIVEAVDGVGIA